MAELHGIRPGDKVQIFFRHDCKPWENCNLLFGTYGGRQDGFVSIVNANLKVPREMLKDGEFGDKYDWLITSGSILAIKSMEVNKELR